jgi:hypothetical protein
MLAKGILYTTSIYFVFIRVFPFQVFYAQKYFLSGIVLFAEMIWATFRLISNDKSTAKM